MFLAFISLVVGQTTGSPQALSSAHSSTLLHPRNDITMAPHHFISWDERLAEYKHNQDNGLASSYCMQNWASKQRTLNANGTLSDERKEKLNSIGFAWNGVYDFEAWNYNFTLLEKHHLEQGTCRGPYQDQQFRKWVKNQRFKLKNKESLTEVKQERWARLNTLGFWDETEQRRESQRNDIRRGRELASPVHQTTGSPQALSPTLLHPQKHITMAPRRHRSWDDWLAEYKHNKENGLASNSSLRTWVSKQRNSNENGTLSDGRKEKLDSVGFTWNRSGGYDCETWNHSFKLMEAHHHEKGNCRGPFQDKQLEQWRRRQRDDMRGKESLNEIQQERWARLNTLGFWDAAEQRKSPRRAGRGSDAALRACHASANAKSDGEMGQGRRGSGIVSTTVSRRLVLLERAPAARPNLPCFTMSVDFQASERDRKRKSGMRFDGC
jgi:Helicase associated domain